MSNNTPQVRYQKQDKLGAGTYGEVYKSYDTVKKMVVAQKVMKFNEEDGIPPTALREMSILKTLHHPNICSLYDVIIEPGSITLIMEYLHVDLRHFFTQYQAKLAENLLQSYAYQLLCGIYEMHVHCVMHRDIKPENLLIDKEGAIKICDFGLARYVSIPLHKYTPDVVSQWYKAPELLYGDKHYELGVDIFALGCVIAEMSRGMPLFKSDSDLDQLHKIFRLFGTPDRESIPNYDDLVEAFDTLPQYEKRDLKVEFNTNNTFLIDLIQRMLALDPSRRITAGEALKHPFFHDVPDLIRQKSLPASLR